MKVINISFILLFVLLICSCGQSVKFSQEECQRFFVQLELEPEFKDAIDFVEEEKFEDALEIFNSYLNESRQKFDRQIEALVLDNIGYVYLKKNDFDLAKSNFDSAFAINKEIRDAKGISYNYLSYGAYYKVKGDFKTSIDYYDRAYDIFKMCDFNDGIAIYYNNVGMVYMEGTKEYNKAKENFMLAAKVNLHFQNYFGYGVNLANLGKIFELENDLNKALKYYSDALKIDKSNNKKFIGDDLRNIARIYDKRQEFQKSANYYEDAYQSDINKDYKIISKIRKKLISDLENLVKLYNLLKNYDKIKQFEAEMKKMKSEE